MSEWGPPGISCGTSSETLRLTFTAQGMLPAPHIAWWRKLLLRLLRRPLPQPIQPPGTQPLVVEQADPSDTGRLLRYYFPAARFDASVDLGGSGE